MDYVNQDEQEYIRFMAELGDKVSEIAKEYNKLSDKNKYHICLFLEQVLWTGIVVYEVAEKWTYSPEKWWSWTIWNE